MKNHIEALLAREKEKFNEAAKKQEKINEQLQILNRENDELFMETSYRARNINLLNRMLIEEEEAE
jgi:hypothetical protein